MTVTRDVSPNFKVARVRSPGHLSHLRTLPCSIFGCFDQLIEAHHLTCSPDRKARGLKAGDNWGVPLCRFHHRALHQAGAESKWWTEQGIAPVPLAEFLWRTSPANPDRLPDAISALF